MSSKPVSARNAGLQKQSVFPEVEVQRSIQKVRSDINETASLGRKSNSFKAVKVRENMLDTSHGVSPEVETRSSRKWKQKFPGSGKGFYLERYINAERISWKRNPV